MNTHDTDSFIDDLFEDSLYASTTGLVVSTVDQRMEQLYLDWQAKLITTDEFRYYSSSDVKLRNYFVVKNAKPVHLHDSEAVQAVVAQNKQPTYLSNKPMWAMTKEEYEAETAFFNA